MHAANVGLTLNQNKFGLGCVLIRVINLHWIRTWLELSQANLIQVLSHWFS
jgi:hypothetical protein